MTVYSRDIVPLSAARSRFSELADEARAGDDKIITKNGEAYVALIDVKKLEYFQQLDLQQQERDKAVDVLRGLEDVEAGRVLDERAFKSSLKKRIARLKAKK
jgi:prevent-host-death family protein